MKIIEVKITEKDKRGKSLSLFNLRDEIVNFLYRDTVALSTKSDLQFYLILFFLAFPVEKKSLLEIVLDDSLPKFKKLNETLSVKNGYLKAGEYAKEVSKHGLTEIFANDIFFILIESILNKDEILVKYANFFTDNSEIKSNFDTVCNKFFTSLSTDLDVFSASRIEDEREDDYGHSHDLSKSVYRMVRMRNSRILNLNLQRYTEVKVITSQSPIDLTFLQYVDLQILFDIWDRLHVVEYTKTVWKVANESPIIANATGGVIGGLVVKYFDWQKLSGRTNKRDKEKAELVFEVAKKQNNPTLDSLMTKLVESVLTANERLAVEVDSLKNKLRDETNRNITLQNKVEIKKLQLRIVKLENLKIDSKLVEGNDNVSKVS